MLRIVIGLLLLGWASVASAQTSFTAKDAAGATQTFKSFNCASNICSISVPVDNTGAALGVSGNPFFTSTAVTGTVAVTGTFWQATQPVSAASLPLPTGAATSALQSTLNTAIGSPFQAGGSIGNTTFAATQSGAWNVTNISGTVSLPTGASTLANQTSQITQETATAAALGTTADSACSTATGACSLIALQKYNNTATNSAIPAGTNLIGKVGIDQTTPGTTNGVAVYNAKGSYETVAATITGQVLGATGATGDYLSHCTVYPTSTSPGVVTVFDSTSSATNNVIAFAGGVTSISNLVPFSFPVGAFSVNGAWKVTTGANLVVSCYGKFT